MIRRYAAFLQNAGIARVVFPGLHPGLVCGCSVGAGNPGRRPSGMRMLRWGREPRALPFAGMRLRPWRKGSPRRGDAYQPRATPWVWAWHDSSVLKERRIGRARVGDPAICGVPSERGHGACGFPRVAPFAGMRMLRWSREPRALPFWYADAPLAQKIGPTGRCIPAQGNALGMGIAKRMRSEGTPHRSGAGG